MQNSAPSQSTFSTAGSVWTTYDLDCWKCLEDLGSKGLRQCTHKRLQEYNDYETTKQPIIEEAEWEESAMSRVHIHLSRFLAQIPLSSQTKLSHDAALSSITLKRTAII